MLRAADPLSGVEPACESFLDARQGGVSSGPLGSEIGGDAAEYEKADRPYRYELRPSQIYELLCAAGVKRLRGKSGEMVAHHSLALLLACLAYNKSLYYYYGTYFFGLSEVSSIPLAFLDAFKMFPDLKASYPKCNAFVRPWTLGVE